MYKDKVIVKKRNILTKITYETKMTESLFKVKFHDSSKNQVTFQIPSFPFLFKTVCKWPQ